MHTDFSFSCGSWFVRVLIWIVITLAFGFSLTSLQGCDFIEGSTVYYQLPPEDQRPLPNETATNTSVAPVDTNYVPLRDVPDIQGVKTFTLGVFKLTEASDDRLTSCVSYGSSFSEQFLDSGAAEGAARFFGSLATLLGGLAVVFFFGLAVSDVQKDIYTKVFKWTLVTAAACQILIFSLFGTSHCGDQYWADFYSLQDQYQTTGTSTTCEMGDSGWYALVAFILFLFAAFLVATRWSDPVCTVFSMEWTQKKDKGRSNAHSIGDQSPNMDEEVGRSDVLVKPQHPIVPANVSHETDEEEEEDLHKPEPGRPRDPSMIGDPY